MTAAPAAGNRTPRSAPLATRMGTATTTPMTAASRRELLAARAARIRSPESDAAGDDGERPRREGGRERVGRPGERAADLERGERGGRVAPHHHAPGEEHQREQQHVGDRGPGQRPELTGGRRQGAEPRGDRSHHERGPLGSPARPQDGEPVENRRGHHARENAEARGRLPHGWKRRVGRRSIAPL